MVDRIAQGFLNDLAYVEQELAVGKFYDFDEDFSPLVEAILTHAGRAFDVPRLDAKAQESEAFDLVTLRTAIESLDTVDLENAQSALCGGRTPLEERDALAQALDYVEDAAKDQHRLETGLRLELSLSPKLFRLQMVLADKPDTLRDLEGHVREKIEPLAEQEVRRLWATLKGEFQASDVGTGRPPMPADKDILGEDFFDPATLNGIRDRIAAYAVRLKPLLVRRMYDKAGEVSVPLSLPEVPHFLASRVVEPLMLLERKLLESLLKIYRVWGKDHEDIFAAALGLPTHHWLELSAQLDSRLRKDAPSGPKKDTLLLITLRQLLNLSDIRVSFDSPMEQSLIQYKLGLEVMLPESAKRVTKLGELALQKELCRFLIERGVLAFGKSFGRSEVDILAELPGERFVIETKVIKRRCRDTIDLGVTQIIAYMDHEEPATRGVLVVYNVSDTIITADKRWHRERLWILPINLCGTSPSKTTKRLTIESGGSDAIVRLIEEPLPRHGVAPPLP